MISHPFDPHPRSQTPLLSAEGFFLMVPCQRSLLPMDKDVLLLNAMKLVFF
ncbi:MAG: hypothetical protein KatS3mg029_0353 [Saprospiraceae bacterium]|nr:MAG: hypothetical protein KatS3mg029_0353 [Saprospiraceae bacterium]